MSNNFKAKILSMLSKNLEAFCPELKDHFMCPTCMKVIPLQEKNRITEAHIIPKAAKGKLKTYLCDECNPRFGSNQDKWFGEYIKLKNRKSPNIMATDIKDGFFWIDGMKVNGQWKERKEGGIEFIIHEDRNSPQIRDTIKEKFGRKPEKIKVTFSIPILGKINEIEIGLLTAGYLMWFGHLGYSWVLQKHLDPIREQILNPHEEILKTRYIVYCEGIRWRPWIGLVTISGEIMLTMGIESSLVLFQPADRINLYDELCEDFTGKVGTDIRVINFFSEPFYGPKVGVLFDRRILVAPDMIKSEGFYDIVMSFTSGSTIGQLLYPCSKEKFEELKKLPNSVYTRIKDGPIIDNNKFWKT